MFKPPGALYVVYAVYSFVVDSTLEDTNTTLDVTLNTNTSCEEHLPDTGSMADVNSGNTVLTNLDDNSKLTATTVEELVDNVADQQVENIKKDALVSSSNNEPEELSGNKEVEELVDKEIQEINKQVNDEPSAVLRSRSITPHSEKIVPGAVSRGVSLEEMANTPEQDEQILMALHQVEIVTDSEQLPKDNVPNRPMTPHQDKIVPGSISRGDLEQVPPEVIPNRPVTPHQDKIVPGAVSRGVSLDEIPKPLPKQDEQISDEPRSRPVTPHCDKIVPGSICRGDLETPAEEITEQSATSPNENSSPGAISKDDLDLPLNTDDKQTENQNEIIPEAK